MRAPRGARPIPVTASQALNGSVLIGGPVRLRGWSLTDGTGSSDLQTEGTAVAPGAGATIASVSLPNGVYLVHWQLELTGTPGAGDVNNVALFIGATQLATSENLGAVGIYNQLDAEAQVIFGPLTLAAKAIGAGVAGSSYTVSLIVVPLANSICAILDGGGTIATVRIDPQSASSQFLGDEGVRIDNSLRVQTSQGTIQGVVYIDLVYPDGDYDKVSLAREY